MQTNLSNAMKRIAVSTLFLIVSYLAFAQPSVHYAYDTNGPLGECLFPQNDKGEVSYVGVVEMPGTASDILAKVTSFIETRKVSLGLGLNKKASSTKSAVYDIKYPLGKEYVEIAYWGSPVFSRTKHASEIAFTCMIEAIDGKFKYTLKDFITKRNTLKGEAKNDGSPNIIHWQRVNSLQKERESYVSKHDIKKRSTREYLYDIDNQIEYEKNLYLLEHSAISSFVEDLKNLALKGEDTFDSDFTSNTNLQTQNNQNCKLDLSNFKGNLLQKGNCVYVSGGTPSEKAGASELIKQITIDSLWTVVSDPSLAHFIIDFHVSTEGRDNAYLVIRNQNSTKSFKGFKRSTDETAASNRSVARIIYMQHLLPKIKKIEQGKTPSEFECFEIK